MCGIVGYNGNRNATDLIFNGLKRLEYRGYDSAGMAILNQESMSLEKASSKLKNLEPLLVNLPEDAPLGIGHTRWATHGPPTVRNAHPHRVDDVVIVHNGIIENHRELKAELGEGTQFLSETDSEVVGVLISRNIKAGMAPRQAILDVLSDLRGTFALGVLFAGDPKTIYVAKQGSPLVIGLGEDENFFGSDTTAFASDVTKAIYLNDGEYAEIRQDKVSCFDFEGKPINPQVVSINGSLYNADKMGYRHFMLKEIHEQPSVMASTLERLVNFNDLTLNDDEMGGLDLSGISNIHIVACGSAYLSGAVARYFLESLLKLPVNVELASEFRYREPFLDEKSLIISISQSGETADTLASVKYAKSLGCKLLSLCNTEFSAIPRASDGVFYMAAGQEVGVASTKAFTSQILCLYLWSLSQAQKLGNIDEARLQSTFEELRRLPFHLDAAIGQKNAIETLARRYYESSNFLYLGRGLSYPIALEGALKLKEISYIHAEGYGAGELKHGPIALVDRHMPIVAVAPNDRYFDKTAANIEEVICREGRVIGVGAEDNEHLKDLCTDYMATPQSTDDVVQSIINSIPLQLFSYYIACHCGTDVDQPRNLAKSVTVE